MSENYNREVIDLLKTALDTPPADWDRILSESCTENPDLKEKVRSLLEQTAAVSFSKPEVPPEGDVAAERPGNVIGNCKLLELLGEGGFGEVWLAAQLKPVRRRVALKLIKPGMDTRAVIARFEAERQALALMEHPHIAKVFDAGTTSRGRPYFMMEYVAGIAITDHCDRHRLTIRQRLELFSRVCDAVSHAHTKGIIHRDLKPSNILVSVRDSQEGMPKIIDFGIAKATQMRLTEVSIYTERGVLIGTPEYMSPEQAEMSQQDIDTRSDIYSLGVILYELLTGALPFDSKVLRAAGLYEFTRLIREVEAPRPSTRVLQLGDSAGMAANARRVRLDELTRTLRSELEWLPLKALRKDRNERYRSAMEMADDVRNYLRGEPLIAGPQSGIYRVRKFVGRNKWPVTTALLIALLLVAALVTLQRAWSRERVAKEDAVLALDKAEVSLEGEKSARKSLQEAETRRLREEASFLMDKALRARSEGSFQRAVLYEATVLSKDFDPLARGRLYLDRAAAGVRLLWTSPGLKGRVQSVAFGPKDQIAAGTEGGLILVWDADSRKQLTEFRAHEGGLRSISFSPDGSRLATGAEDRTVRVWDVRSGAEAFAAEGAGHKGAVNCVVYSPDGSRIASGGADKAIILWDASNGIEVRTLLGETPITGAAFSPDSSLLAAHEDQRIAIWNVASGEVLRKYPSTFAHSRCVAWSPDGKLLASGSTWPPVRVAEAETGDTVADLPGHLGTVLSLAFCKDKNLLASGSADHTIGLWDIENEALTGRLAGHEAEVMSISVDPSGERLVSGSRDQTVRLWDVKRKKAIAALHGHSESVQAIAMSPDSATVASTGKDKYILVSHRATGRPLHRFTGHEDEVTSFAFLPDGNRLISGSKDATARFWDMRADKEAGRVSCAGAVEAIAVSPSGAHFAAGASRQVQVFDVGSKTEAHKLDMGSEGFALLAFDQNGLLFAESRSGAVKVWEGPSGKLIASAQDQAEGITAAALSRTGSIASAFPDGQIRVWDPRSGKESARLRRSTKEVVALAFHPKNPLLFASCSDNWIRRWEFESDRDPVLIEGHSAAARALCLSGDGRWLATGSEDRTVKMWDTMPELELGYRRFYNMGDVAVVAYDRQGTVFASSGQNRFFLRSLRGTEAARDIETGGPRPLSLDFDPGGALIVCGSDDGSVVIWDVLSGKQVGTLSGHKKSVLCVRYSRDGSMMASGSTDKTCKLWKTKTREEVASLDYHYGSVSSVVFGPNDDFLVSASHDNSIIVSDIPPTRIRARLIGHVSPVHSIALHPGGKMLASASEDRTVRLWDLESFQEICALSGHSQPVLSVGFSPDGKWIASASMDRSVRIWDASSRKEAARMTGFRGRVEFLSVAFHPDGNQLAAGATDWNAHLWDLAQLLGPGEDILARMEKETGLRLEGNEVKLGFSSHLADVEERPMK